MRLRSIKQIQGASQAPFCCCCCLWVCCQGCLTTLTNVLNKWQAALAGFPCTSNVLLEVNPAVPLLLGRDGRNSSGRTSCFVGSQPPCSGGVHMRLWKSLSCGHKWQVWWGGNIYLLLLLLLLCRSCNMSGQTCQCHFLSLVSVWHFLWWPFIGHIIFPSITSKSIIFLCMSSISLSAMKCFLVGHGGSEMLWLWIWLPQELNWCKDFLFKPTFKF